MSESIELFHEAQFINIILPRPIDLYMLTPYLKIVNIASDHDITNFSFITSVSNDFQKKNTIFRERERETVSAGVKFGVGSEEPGTTRGASWSRQGQFALLVAP